MSDRLPLNALHAFAAAARAGSFSRAAEDMGVTAAAISQQVRLLEARLGKELFFRRPNGIEMTDAGRALHLRLAGAFADLALAVDEARSRSSRPGVVISVIPSLGELWLLPRLAGLDASIGVQIVEDDRDPVDLTARGVDLRLTYGAEAYPGQEVLALFQDRMLPVAAPGFAPPADLADLPEAAMIHTNWGPAYSSPQSWAQWFQAGGTPRAPDPGKGLGVERLAVAAAAARQGLGVALLPETLAADDLAQGRLCAVGPARGHLPQPYALLARPGARRRPAVDLVWRHLAQGRAG